jgi:hypothetical protein
VKFHFLADDDARYALIVHTTVEGWSLGPAFPPPDQLMEEHAGEFLDLVKDFFAAKLAAAAPAEAPISWDSATATAEKFVQLVPAPTP